MTAVEAWRLTHSSRQNYDTSVILLEIATLKITIKSNIYEIYIKQYIGYMKSTDVIENNGPSY